jgi:hypothetical protein
MKISTIAMMLTLLVAGLAIGCSSAPVPNFSEEEAIAIGRSYHRDAEKARFEQAQKTYAHFSYNACFSPTTPAPYINGDVKDFNYTNVRHITSASFKANGIWLVTAETSYDFVKKGYSADSGTRKWDCLYLVDDSTGKVRPN